MPAIQLHRRDDASSSLTPTVFNLLIALVVLFAVAACSVAGLFTLRLMRKKRAMAAEQLPVYSEKPSNPRGLSIQTPSYANAEKQALMDEGSPPTSPVPEIRITFPEEIDASGKRQSGRVVVVRVGEHSVGLEPVNDGLPPYAKEDGRFQSLDLDRMGGLKERQ
ncbi:hypothetical protein EJ06DRAFT_559363 [Trichodelitschia bisporula]|uniref:Uncharacterized protein n=1 Tax=Trichodelitschia bisporula TaxID=703511 RepID=A0A6G1HMF9_9PEZI|nr:hypothetical protein EJ06DRAFT_559363 [Trichodelitschia bisporula]